MKKFLAFAVFCFLPACETYDYQGMLNQWIGQPKSRLVQVWGPPSSLNHDRTYDFYVYENSDTRNYSGVAPYCYQTDKNGQTITKCNRGTPGRTEYLDCRVTFTIVNDRIIRADQSGNYCYGIGPRRELYR